MTTTQRISFTALPNGVVPASSPLRLKLSVFVSARLSTDPKSDEKMDLHTAFPQFADWPATNPTFGVKFGGGAEVAATIVSAPPRSDLWGMLFPDTSYLRPHDFEEDLTKVVFTTYSVKEVHSGLKKIYTYFAKLSPTDWPSVNQLLSTDSPLKNIALLAMPVHKTVITTPKIGSALASLLVTTTPANASEFGKVETYHKPFTDVRVTPTPPDVDFHSMLSALGRYPVLMRMLGLVYDLEVNAPATTGDVTVEIVPHFDAGGATIPQLVTNAHVSATHFYARRRATDPELTDDGLGMLPLEDATKYEVVQVNHDGAALKTLRFTDSVIHAHFDSSKQLFKDLVPSDYLFNDGVDKLKKYETADTPNEYSLPAMGTAGIAVARAQNASIVSKQLTTAKGKNDEYIAPSGTVELDAEDLTRGYAIDVWDSDTSAWHSLCERVGTYRFSGTTLTGIADEGWVGVGMTGAQDGTGALTKKLQETLFNYWGWSLVAPRPGKTMDENGQPAYTENNPATQFDLKVDFVAKPGSLPRLRFGRKYRLRARAVDVAGNSTPRSSVTDFTHATAEVTHGRFEPVASPEVVLDDPLAEGDARDRLVIRSNYDTAISGPAIRHIAPPKAPEPMIEALGLFDAPGGFDAKAYKLLQQKDGGSWVDIGKPDPNNPGVVYVKEEGKILPYLPDVLSRGALFRELPGSGTPKFVSFGYDAGQAWPNALPFDLVLREGSGDPQFDKGPRSLNVPLGKGDVVQVKLSSYIDKDKDKPRMALADWMSQPSDILTQPGDYNSFSAFVDDGSHWMVMPFRTLTLVHAVRQPLLRPAFGGWTFGRQLKDTFATLNAAGFTLSRKSTARLDVLAQWSETIDTDAAGPKVVNGSARPFQVKVALDPAHEQTLDFTGQHEFHDTKYRHVKYSVDATSRFAEYFAERKSRMQVHKGIAIEIAQPTTSEGVNWGAVVERSESVTAADRTTRYKRGTDYTIDYAAGKLTPLASLDGRTVNVTFIPQPIVRRTAESRELDIKSSARPAAPKVLYLIPTFGWTSSANQAGTEYKSERRGGGLRAYLDRPWFSSGDGEMLGVVIWTGPWPPDETTKMYVSDWGLDPLYKSAPTTDRPTLGAFKTASATKTDKLTLEELKDDTIQTLHVAGHPVGYDAARKLWYADIEIDAGASYTPFVRLALARYQPHSVDGAHLSRVVLADFVQLTANRAASLTRPTKQSDTLNVAVSGLSYSISQGVAGSSIVEVSLEARRANTEPDKQAELAWEQVPASTKTLTPSAGPAGTTMWTGQVTLPKTMGDRFRVVIQEFEKFGTDRRLVYADAIEV